MGVYAFRLPDIGEGVVEGEVVQWHVTAGNAVNEDDPLIDVMTDKATVTIPSPVTGVIIKTMGEAGEIISVGSVCIEFEVDGEGNSVSVVAPEKEVEKEPAEKPKVLASWMIGQLV